MTQPTETEIREFDLSDILSVTTGVLLSRRHVEGLYDLMGFMTGDSLYTHQLGRAMDSCKPELLRQMPWLANVVPPEFDGDDSEVVKAAVFGWVDTVEAIHGRTHTVRAGAPGWRSGADPVAELDQMMGNRPVVVVRPDGSVSS